MSLNGFAHQDQAQAIKSNWLQQSVRHFFEACAWEGEPFAPPSSAVTQVHQATHFWSHSVSHFWGTFPWEGISEVAAPAAVATAVQPEVSEAEELTLDAFSDLF
ncbi:MAG: hypothetical protein ACTS3T_21090 [Almyronema sp.]